MNGEHGGLIIPCGSLKAAAKGSVAYLVEPIPKHLRWGQMNFKLNEMSGHFINAAIGKISQHDVTIENWDGSVVHVPALTVDDLMEQEGLTKIDILHADIQGAEYDLLLGSRQALKCESISYVFLSTHAEHLHQDCLWLLKRCGQRVIAEHTPSESFSVDGLIVTCTSNLIQRPIRISKRSSWKSIKLKWRSKIRTLIKTAAAPYDGINKR